MELLTKEQADKKRDEIKIEIQKRDVEAQEMQCAIAELRAKIAAIESSVESVKLRKAALYVEWEGIKENAATC